MIQIKMDTIKTTKTEDDITGLGRTSCFKNRTKKQKLHAKGEQMTLK